MPASKAHLTDPVELRRLYIEDGLSTRDIGEQFGVAHITVRRWLAKYNIPLRPPGSGLEHHGLPKPNKEQLERLVGREDKTYAEVAAIYGVDLTAIPQWLDAFQIPRRKRRALPIGPEEASRRYLELGESAETIAESVGVSKTTMFNILKRAGVERRDDGWRARVAADDGTVVRSTYELRVANWLASRGVPYEYEPRIPFGHARCRADFLVNDWYVEIWGVHSVPGYLKQKAWKRSEYRTHEIPLVELSPHHFSRDTHILASRLEQLCERPHRRLR